jgi:hypothetical protein
MLSLAEEWPSRVDDLNNEKTFKRSGSAAVHESLLHARGGIYMYRRFIFAFFAFLYTTQE